MPKSEDRDRYESSAVEGDAALAISSLAFVSYRTLVQVSQPLGMLRSVSRVGESLNEEFANFYFSYRV